MSICSQRSDSHQIGGFEITTSIKSTTTPEEFDQLVSQFPGYKLEHGGRCGWNALGIAAFKGNLNLVRHIVSIGSENLLSLGNEFGWAPLFCAANGEDREAGFIVAKELLSLGAEINLATSFWSGDTRKGDTPASATPLWAAIERSKNRSLIRFLIKKGGVVSPELSKEGKELLDSVLQELEEESKRIMLFCAGYFKSENKDCYLQTLPKDIIILIYRLLMD